MNQITLIIDGNSHLYRAYYAFPNFFNKNREPSGAIHGFLNMIFKVIFIYNPNKVIIVFDSPKKNFRHVLYPNYKFHRSPMPNDLICQIKPLIRIIDSLGIPVLTIPKFEADDVIGTLAYKNNKNNKNQMVLISSNDKDMAQLVNHKTQLINFINCNMIGIPEVKNKYGVFPDTIIDFLSLTGDASDNIPGVSGIGKKTAVLLLNKFYSLTNIYNNLKEISKLPIRGAKCISSKLEKNKKQAFLSRKLVTIQLNIKLDIPYEEIKLRKPCLSELFLLFEYYNFKHLTKIIKNQTWIYHKI